MSNKITIPIEIDDESIKKLEKVKQLLIDIKEIDKELKLSNVINISDNTVLVFSINCLIRKEDRDNLKDELEEITKCKCILLHRSYT